MSVLIQHGMTVTSMRHVRTPLAVMFVGVMTDMRAMEGNVKVRMHLIIYI